MFKTLCIALLGLSVSGCAGTPPVHLGAAGGKFAPCPNSPNCVSSQAGDPDHFVEPLRYEGSKQAAFDKLKQVVSSMKRTKVAEITDDYMRVEFKSAIMGFVDDCEFYLADDGIIHLKSASRKGYSDFGVNRKRIEKIRQLFDRQ